MHVSRYNDKIEKNIQTSKCRIEFLLQAQCILPYAGSLTYEDNEERCKTEKKETKSAAMTINKHHITVINKSLSYGYQNFT